MTVTANTTPVDLADGDHIVRESPTASGSIPKKDRREPGQSRRSGSAMRPATLRWYAIHP